MPAFIDTNVLIYALSADQRKAERALELMQDGGWISVQVLNESVRVLRGKLRYEWPAVHHALARIQAMLAVVTLDIDTHRLGIGIAERYRLSIFDSMIAGAAILAGCDTLYSQDMQHGLVISGRLTIVNPFRS